MLPSWTRTGATELNVRQQLGNHSISTANGINPITSTADGISRRDFRIAGSKPGRFDDANSNARHKAIIDKWQLLGLWLEVCPCATPTREERQATIR